MLIKNCTNCDKSTLCINEVKCEHLKNGKIDMQEASNNICSNYKEFSILNNSIVGDHNE